MRVYDPDVIRVILLCTTGAVADLATLQLLAWVPRAQKAYFAASKCKYVIWEWKDTSHETESLGITPWSMYTYVCILLSPSHVGTPFKVKHMQNIRNFFRWVQ